MGRRILTEGRAWDEKRVGSLVGQGGRFIGTGSLNRNFSDICIAALWFSHF